MSNIFYTLHEYGAPSHFFGLEYLLKDNGKILKHRELNLVGQVKNSVKSKSFKGLIKFFKNLSFILLLIITKDKKIILAIAPYNFNLKFLKRMLSRHNVFYFTSYTCWDQSRMVHGKFYSESVLKIWKTYINHQIKHVFAVSDLTKREMIKNKFCNSNKISVVNHSYNIDIDPGNGVLQKKNFIVVGRLSHEKGILELLKIFKIRSKLNITFVGDGSLRNQVEEVSNNYENISYLGYIRSLEDLVPIYKANTFLILNSKSNEVWEELFGLVLVEAMACGLIPIATKHSGPLEIIEDNKNGFLSEEGEIQNVIQKVCVLDNDKLKNIRESAIDKGKEFHHSLISKKWLFVLNDY